MANNRLSSLIAHTKAYGFLYPSSEIYEGIQAVYDYGPMGALLKRKLQQFWWQSMTQLHENIVGLDAAIFMNKKTWEASGHIAGFHDWMVDNKDSHKRYRVDKLIEEKVSVWKKQGKEAKANQLMAAMGNAMSSQDGDALRGLLVEHHIVCPISKTSHWTSARELHLMFATHTGPTQDHTSQVYLRPETAQGIFVNFLNIQKTTRQSLPFGVAQIGKAFRNELIARQFIFRMREFEQMEMQFFIPPEKDEKWFATWRDKRQSWYQVLGIPTHKMSIHPHEKLAHYANAAVDILYEFPFGANEVEGIHARGSFDLTNHEKLSKKKMTYFDPQENRSYIPHVVETSAGCDRLILMLLCEAFQQEEGRTYLKLPKALSPIQVAVLPLMKQEPFIKIAKKIYQEIRYDFSISYEERGSIGKRYTRQDLIGTPYCITVDHQTLQDETITVRERDSMHQHRLPISDLSSFLHDEVALKNLLKKLKY